MPIIKIHNAETGEIIEREMTAEETAVYERDLENAEKYKVAMAEAAAKRQALLDKLGITEEEARLLLG